LRTVAQWLEVSGEAATALERRCKSIRIPNEFVSAKRTSQGPVPEATVSFTLLELTRWPQK